MFMNCINALKMKTQTAKKTTQKDPREKIIESYISHVLEHGSEPKSIFKFTQELKMKEGDFYSYFTSMEGIKAAIWSQILDETLSQLRAQEVYPSYSSREKFLGFLFTWIEVLKNRRSFLLALYQKQSSRLGMLPAELKTFRKDFLEFSTEILKEGEESQEITKRPILSDRYGEALWVQVLFVLKYWMEDQSPRFEKTDAAIEKSVNLAFDLMGQSALDRFLDFAKFLYQNK